MPSKKQRSRSLESVSPDFGEMLQQKTIALCQRKESASPKPYAVQLIQQRQDSEQDETPSTLSSPPSLPSTDGQNTENPDEEVLSSTSCSQTPTTLITTTTTLSPVQTPLMPTPSPTCPKPEVKEDTSSKSNHNSANNRYHPTLYLDLYGQYWLTLGDTCTV